MSAKLKNRSWLVWCVLFFAAGCAGTAIGREQASVLSRVQTVDDVELGELIRVALENLPESKRLAKLSPYTNDYEEQRGSVESAKLKTVRLVTEAYAAIKLLDSQIDQIDAKINSPGMPETLMRELLLAKAELQSNLETKLAELREVMGIIPRHALGRKPVKELNGWLKLDVIGDRVCIFDCSKPFQEYSETMRHTFVKLLSGEEALNYAVNFVRKRDNLPVRVDILRNVDGIELSKLLHNQIIDAVKKANLAMEAEVHLDEEIRRFTGSMGHLFLLQGKIGMSLRTINKSLISGKRQAVKEIGDEIDANDIDSYVRDQLITRPGQLPSSFQIGYDQESKDVALRVVNTIQEAVKQLGLEKFVGIVQEQISPGETN